MLSALVALPLRSVGLRWGERSSRAGRSRRPRDFNIITVATDITKSIDLFESARGALHICVTPYKIFPRSWKVPAEMADILSISRNVPRRMSTRMSGCTIDRLRFIPYLFGILCRVRSFSERLRPPPQRVAALNHPDTQTSPLTAHPPLCIIIEWRRLVTKIVQLVSAPMSSPIVPRVSCTETR
jgi:hypothetical protein